MNEPSFPEFVWSWAVWIAPLAIAWLLVGNLVTGYYRSKNWCPATDEQFIVVTFWPGFVIWTYLLYYPVTISYEIGLWLGSKAVPTPEEVIQKEPPSE